MLLDRLKQIDSSKMAFFVGAGISVPDMAIASKVTDPESSTCPISRKRHLLRKRRFMQLTNSYSIPTVGMAAYNQYPLNHASYLVLFLTKL